MTKFRIYAATVLASCALAAGIASLPACQATNGVIANGWTVTAAANVEYSAGLSLELKLATLKQQLPSEAGAITAAQQALGDALITQVVAMESGQSTLAQTKGAAISTVLSVLPNLNMILASAPANINAAQALSDALTFLNDDIVYVAPAILKANAGTATSLDVLTALAAFRFAAGLPSQ